MISAALPDVFIPIGIMILCIALVFYKEYLRVIYFLLTLKKYVGCTNYNN
ncbi:hypothetical protein PA25_29640 [Pseudoalteromonas sp. A25]|nr:hypothetical protein PA25_29640 [Pseudoalteromonas sp. A25]